MNYSCSFLLGKKKCKLIINFFSPNTSARITSVTCHDEYRNAQISVVCVYNTCFPVNFDSLTGYRYINMFFFFYKTIPNCGRRRINDYSPCRPKLLCECVCVCVRKTKVKSLLFDKMIVGVFGPEKSITTCVFVTTMQTTGGRLGPR